MGATETVRSTRSRSFGTWWRASLMAGGQSVSWEGDGWSCTRLWSLSFGCQGVVLLSL